MQFIYELNEMKFEEVMTSAHWKNTFFLKWNQFLMGALALALITAYGIRPDLFYLALIGACFVFILFYAAYFVSYRRRKLAKRAARKMRRYSLKIADGGIYTGAEGTYYDLKTQKWEFLEAEHVYTLKLSGIFFGVPKRILTKEGVRKLEQLAANESCRKIKLITKKVREKSA